MTPRPSGYLLPLLLTLASGCAGTQTEEPSGTPELAAAPYSARKADIERDYYPLRVGNTWTYKVRTLGEETEQTIGIDRQEGKFFHQAGSAGALLRLDGYGIRDKNRYLLRFPIALGTQWQSVLAHNSVEHYEITAVGAEVTVPAGSFQGCVVVASKQAIDKDRLLTNQMTFAPGVGIVRLQTVLHQTGKPPLPQVTMELARYQVGPTAPTPAPGAAPAP